MTLRKLTILIVDIVSNNYYAFLYPFHCQTIYVRLCDFIAAVQCALIGERKLLD